MAEPTRTWITICALALWLAACNRSSEPAPPQGNVPVAAISPVATTILAPPATATVAPSLGPSPSPSPAASPSPSPSPLASAGIEIRREGTYEGGTYRYVVPPDWNGGLVLYAHGVQQGFGPIVENPPIADHLTARGYAWAASSYRASEYVPNLGMDDTLALKRLFVREVGQPRWTILYGQSMGGHIVTASLETYPHEYQAGLAECGVVDGIWEIDFLAAYTAAAQEISGVPLLGAPDADTLRRLVEQEWLPIMGRPGEYTEKGRQFDSVVKHLMGGDLPYRLEGLGWRYASNLTPYAGVDPATVPAFPHVDTTNVVYKIDPGFDLTAEELNQRVPRLSRQPGSRDPARDPAFADRTGRLSGPLLTLHTTGDAWVPLSHQQRYRQKAMAAGADHLLVQRAIRRALHCEFTAGERTQAFDDLVAWLETGARPEGDDVLAEDLSQIGVRWTSPPNPDDPVARR